MSQRYVGLLPSQHRGYISRHVRSPVIDRTGMTLISDITGARWAGALDVMLTTYVHYQRGTNIPGVLLAGERFVAPVVI